MRLSSARWPEIDARASASTLVVPLGSTEQHGPHLPLSTDTDVAVALAVRLANVRSHMIVAPALPYGSSGEHAGFAGTLSIGQEALELVVIELVRSADDVRRSCPRVGARRQRGPAGSGGGEAAGRGPAGHGVVAAV